MRIKFTVCHWTHFSQNATREDYLTLFNWNSWLTTSFLHYCMEHFHGSSPSIWRRDTVRPDILTAKGTDGHSVPDIAEEDDHRRCISQYPGNCGSLQLASRERSLQNLISFLYSKLCPQEWPIHKSAIIVRKYEILMFRKTPMIVEMS